MTRKTSKILGISGFITIMLVVLDQISKFAAVTYLKNHEPFVIIDNVFELHYLENQSAAFGIDFISIIQKLFHFQYFIDNPQAFLTLKMVFFAIITIAVVIILIWIYYRIPFSPRYNWLNLILILFIAGAIGNLIDRVVQNYVVDFFYFKLINFPIFNVADIYVTVAAFLFIVLGLFYYKEEDYDLIFPSNKVKEEK